MFQSHNLHHGKQTHKSPFEALVTVAAFLYPLSGLPQVIMVFRGSAEGVSVLSWLGFTVFSALFLVYGIRRHIRPMVIINGLWLVIDILTVIGTVVDTP